MHNLALMTALVALLMLLTTCGEFVLDNPNGQGPDPIMRPSFRNGNSFPHANPVDDVLLLELDDSDIGAPSTVRIYIGSDKVLTISRFGGTHEVPFPPATWTPTSGDYIVRVESGGIERTLKFSWN